MSTQKMSRRIGASAAALALGAGLLLAPSANAAKPGAPV